MDYQNMVPPYQSRISVYAPACTNFQNNVLVLPGRTGSDLRFGGSPLVGQRGGAGRHEASSLTVTLSEQIRPERLHRMGFDLCEVSGEHNCRGT